MFKHTKRPLIILGYGVRLAGAVSEALEFVRLSGMPAVCTWGAADFFRHDDPLYVGTFGTHGQRHANFAVQNADFILSIGSRLDTKATGAPVSSFAPRARIVMVDADAAELDKFVLLGRAVTGICADAKAYLNEMLACHPRGDYAAWVAQIHAWRARYPIVLPEYREEQGINPYVFVEALSQELREDDVIVSDTGCVLGWMMQAFKFSGQRFVHAFNNTPMGYGLPAAIGAALATGQRTILVCGDGGLGVNIGELATLARHALAVKVVLFNNRGHAMCRQTQRQWLGGEYPATSYEGGLACPDYASVARAYGIEALSTKWIDAAKNLTRRMLEDARPGFLELEIDPGQGIAPQVRFGCALEDGDPRLPAAELAQVMKEAA